MLLSALGFAALLALCTASSAIIFGPIRRTSRCVLADGRQGRCVYPTSCPTLTGSTLPDCVKPCELTRHHELLICCPLDALTTTTTTTTTTTSRPARDSSCGQVQVANNLVRHIAFGRPALQGLWPWMALYGWRDARGRLIWQCGGTLISARHVLTAAHCVERRGRMDVVRVGEHDLASSSDAVHQDVAVLRTAVPPTRHAKHDDIALLTLEKSVRFNELVQPACLPSSVGDDPAVESDVIVAGWGRIEFSGPTSDELQEAVQQVVSTDKCEEMYTGLRLFAEEYPGGLGTSKICALDTTGGHEDACRGDSGGPLMTHDGDFQYTVVGVVSIGIGCGNPAYPSIYTRVSSYVDWIQEQMV